MEVSCQHGTYVAWHLKKSGTSSANYGVCSQSDTQSLVKHQNEINPVRLTK